MGRRRILTAAPGTDAQVVAALRAAGCVFAEDEARLLMAAARSAEELARMVAARAAGSPLEQAIGHADFCGLRIFVDKGVFVPRRRTEFLVQQAVALSRPGGIVVDMCCGSGAVGAALAATVDRVDLYAADIDAAAVQCARRNIAPERVFEGDLYDALPGELRGRIDVLVCNAPYVPSDDIRLLPAEARLHEPLTSLDGGADGVDIQRRVAAAATDWLTPTGHLLIETSARQVAGTSRAMTDAGLDTRAVASDEYATIVIIGTPRQRRSP